MANGIALAEPCERKGKLDIRHPSAFRYYLFSNGLEGTRIRFDRNIPYPYGNEWEKRAFLDMFMAEFAKRNGVKKTGPEATLWQANPL